MNNSFLSNRRKFIKGSAAAGVLSLAPGSIRAANKASNYIRVGVIGLSGEWLTSVDLPRPRGSRWRTFATLTRSALPGNQGLEGWECQRGRRFSSNP